MESQNRLRTLMEDWGHEKIGDSCACYGKEADFVTQMENEQEIIAGCTDLGSVPCIPAICLWQAFLMQIPTLSSILRVLSRNYDIKKSFENFTADGLEDSIELGKWSTLLANVLI